jgi:hypothetical protein
LAPGKVAFRMELRVEANSAGRSSLAEPNRDAAQGGW